jgi:large subunit ribosomal protein L14
MMQMQTRFIVADNTGAKEVAMIRKIGHLSPVASLGDVIIVAVKESTPDASVKKGTVARALIVRSSYPIKRADGSYIRFDQNAVIIIDKDGNPKGTRIFGVIPRELRQKRYMKILSLAPEVL